MIVPVVFLILCIVGFFFTGLPLKFLIDEIIIRLARNLVLVLSLILPVITGMGLNFGIVLGAMAGLVTIQTQLGGAKGLFLSFLISTPVAALLGFLVGKVLNKAKGKEMITSMILGFFANGVYQLVFLILAGTIIPIRNKSLLLSTGIGLKNTVDLINVRSALDNLIPFDKINLGFFQWLSQYPISTLLFTLLLFLLVSYFLKTKLGQDMRAVGQDMNIAEVSGINVDRTRIIAIMMSTILAA